MIRSFICSAIFASILLPVNVAAATLNFSGTTAGGASWNRPVEDLSGLSTLGTKARYSVTNFAVDTDGIYSFISVADNDWDNFLFLYQGAFDPNSPLTNALIANDDNPGIGSSAFTLNLLANTNYLLVTTGYANTDFGGFVNTIDGNGNFVGQAQEVPEPYTILGTLFTASTAIVMRRKLQTRKG